MTVNAQGFVGNREEIIQDRIMTAAAAAPSFLAFITNAVLGCVPRNAQRSDDDDNDDDDD